jgi:hypothetical protein
MPRPRTQKRQGTAAVQDAHALAHASRNREASWSAAVLCRFGWHVHMNPADTFQRGPRPSVASPGAPASLPAPVNDFDPAGKDAGAPGEGSAGMRQTETHTELLILPDGRILVQNLTPAMAALLQELDSRDGSMQSRATVARNAARKSRTGKQTHRTSHEP